MFLDNSRNDIRGTAAQISFIVVGISVKIALRRVSVYAARMPGPQRAARAAPMAMRTRATTV